MKFKNLAKIVGATLLGIASLTQGPAPVSAEQLFHPKPATKEVSGNRNTFEADSRVKYDYVLDRDGAETHQTSIGIAPKGTYGDRLLLRQLYDETFLLLDVHTRNGKEEGQHFTLAHLKTPKLIIGDLENQVLLFGGLGDLEGFGVETQHSLRNLTIALTAEQRFGEKIDRAKKIGFGLDYRVFDALTLGFGFDSVDKHVRVKKGKLAEIVEQHDNQFLFNALINPSNNDTIGVVYAFTQMPESKDQSVGISALHFDDKSRWGARAKARYDWNHEREFERFGGRFQIAEYPTFERIGPIQDISRNVGYFGVYNKQLIPLFTELIKTRQPDWAYKGWSLTLEGATTRLAKQKQQFVGVEVGYAFPKVTLGQFGLSTGLRHELITTNDTQTMQLRTDRTDFLNMGIIYRIRKFELDVGVSIPVFGTTLPKDPFFRAALQYNF